MYAIIFFALFQVSRSIQCNLEVHDDKSNGICDSFQGIEPMAVADPINDQVVCLWPNGTSPEDCKSVQIGQVRPVDYENWTKVSSGVKLPSLIRSHISSSPLLQCKGSKSCCFQKTPIEEVRVETFKMTPPVGPYKTGFGKYNVTGMVCGSPTAEVLAWFPYHLDQGPFPFVVFGHGLGSGIARDLIQSIASLGMVVVAPKDFQRFCPSHIDDLKVIEESRANPNLFKALPHVDFSSVGIIGHSMGGNQAIAAATEIGYPNSYNLKAVVASHGVNNVEGLKIPAMFETSPYDRTVYPDKVKDAFSKCTPNPKVFISTIYGGHMEPSQDGLGNPWMAHFLGCHVAGLVDSCQKVYLNSTADSMCQDKNLSQCLVVKPDWL
jgi:dienelactone hydrolase